MYLYANNENDYCRLNMLNASCVCVCISEQFWHLRSELSEKKFKDCDKMQKPKCLSFPPETNPLVVSLKAGLTLHVIQAQFSTLSYFCPGI